MNNKVATILYKLEELSSEIEGFDKNLYLICPNCKEMYSMPFNFCSNCGTDLTDGKNKLSKQRIKLAQFFTEQLKDILGITDDELKIILKEEGYVFSEEKPLELTDIQATGILDNIIFNIHFLISDVCAVYMKIVMDDITKDNITIVKERCANYIKEMDEAHEKTKGSKLIFRKEEIKEMDTKAEQMIDKAIDKIYSNESEKSKPNLFDITIDYMDKKLKENNNNE